MIGLYFFLILTVLSILPSISYLSGLTRVDRRIKVSNPTQSVTTKVGSIDLARAQLIYLFSSIQQEYPEDVDEEETEEEERTGTESFRSGNYTISAPTIMISRLYSNKSHSTYTHAQGSYQ